MRPFHRLCPSPLFPSLLPFPTSFPFCFSSNQMHNHLHALQTYLTPFSTSLPAESNESLDGTKLHSLLQPFFETIVPHLRNELNTLAPERLEGKLTKEDFKEINAIVEGKLKTHGPHTFLVSCQSVAFECRPVDALS